MENPIHLALPMIFLRIFWPCLQVLLVLSVNSMPQEGRDPGAITNLLTMPIDFNDPEPLVRAQDRERLQGNSIMGSADIHGLVDDELKKEKTNTGNGGIKLFGVTIFRNSMPQKLFGFTIFRNSMPQGRDLGAVTNTMPVDFSDPEPTKLVGAQHHERVQGNSIMGSANIQGLADDEIKNEKTDTDNGAIKLFGVTIIPKSNKTSFTLTTPKSINFEFKLV